MDTLSVSPLVAFKNIDCFDRTNQTETKVVKCLSTWFSLTNKFIFIFFAKYLI